MTTMSFRRKCMFGRTLVDDHRALLLHRDRYCWNSRRKARSLMLLRGQMASGSEETAIIEPRPRIKLGNRAVRRNTALAGVLYRGKYVLVEIAPPRPNQSNGRSDDSATCTFLPISCSPLPPGFSRMECSAPNSAVNYRFVWWPTNCNERCARMKIAERPFPSKPQLVGLSGR